MKTIRFERRDDGSILTIDGTHFSGSIKSLGGIGHYEVWHVAPGHVYSGQGRPWRRTSARLLLVKASGFVAVVIKECKPSAKWAAKRREFLDEMSNQFNLAMFAGED